MIIHLHTFLSLSATGHHWLAALSTYDFSVLYRSGKNNTDADFAVPKPGTRGQHSSLVGLQSMSETKGPYATEFLLT